ncbi:MAG: caspase family protein [Pseudomonadota bacterium]
MIFSSFSALRARFKAPVVIAALAAFSASAQAPGDVRVALVIGNAAYAGPLALQNPASDAGAMAGALKGLGFEVVELRNGSKAQMNDAVTKVREILKGKQGIGMLYYAGHGLQMDARNYMVPLDANLTRGADVVAQTVDVGSVIEAFRAAGNRMNILVLDACRDNPFGGITTGKGLAPLDAPSGTFLAYATAPGNVAEDGDVKSGNGLYTQYLLQELKKPQARIEDVFKRVRLSVRKASNGRQIPWESTSLEDDFQFNDGRLVAQARPTGDQLAAEFNREKADWDRIKDSTRADDFYAFLEKFPNGTVSEAALARLNQLNKPVLVVQGADGTGKPFVRDAFRAGDEFDMAYTGSDMRLLQKVTRVTADEVLVSSVISTNGKVDSGNPTVEVFDRAGGSRGIQGVFSYNPPQNFFPAEQVKVGEHWKFGYETSPLMAGMPGQRINGESRVLARETVKVEAGTFQAFKVESVTYSSLDSSMRTRCLFWLTPDLPTYIKMECGTTSRARPQPVLSKVELARVKRGA